MKREGRLAALLFLSFLTAVPMFGQSAHDGFDPNANGNVNVVVVQPDDKILIGGNFTTVWQFSAVTLAQSATISGSVSCRTSSTVNDTNGTTPENHEKQPWPDGGSTPDFPDSTTDLEDSDGDLDDFIADTSTRNYQDTPLLSATSLDALALRAPEVSPVGLLPVHCPNCLRDQIRERAPPLPE